MKIKTRDVEIEVDEDFRGRIICKDGHVTVLSAGRQTVGERLMTKGAQRIAAFGFGVTFVSVLLVLALFVPNPTPFQYTVFRIVLALAAGGVAAMIPGFIQLTISSWVQAGGALAVFLIVFFYSPAALVVT